MKAHAFSKTAEAGHHRSRRYRRGRCPSRWGDRPSAGQGQPVRQPLTDDTVRRRGSVADQEPLASAVQRPATCSGSPTCRGKILFTLLIIALYRFGSCIPAPGIDLDAVRRSCAGRRSREPACSASSSCSPAALAPVRALRARDHAATSPASIIMQILTVVIPKLEEWQQMGAVGQRKITQWTRYLAITHRPAAVHRPGVPLPQRRRRPASAVAATPPASTCCPTSRPSA